MSADAIFREAAAERRVKRVPLSHLSIELGHLYMEDFVQGPERLRELFRRVVPWAAAARQTCADRLSGKRPRISTCFLIDDYFTRFKSPAEVVPDVLNLARENGLEIDYLARESGCAKADGVPLARLVEGRIVPDPPPETNGARPPVTESGWLSNGQRSPVSGSPEAMGSVVKWRPPSQNAANRHSIFIDIELWDEGRGGRTWSCPFLAAVWQLLRLGMLRNEGEPVAVPQPWTDDWPGDWDELPAVVKINPNAAPFSAYATMSVLPNRFLPIEIGVRTILSQVWPDQDVSRQLREAAERDGVQLPTELVDRLSYAFT
ncbi:SCO2522 family protein [Phytohabitans kaempferiae]|uniref:SCO2522 family protein n=1 Tax=Phytohabitans kaempferiae TaxID=1620943 RepID=A0ABV6M886_9ACTN